MPAPKRIALAALLLATLPASMSVSGCASQDPEVACGWDLSTQRGKDASNARLTFVLQWQIDHPGEPPPPPDSPFWRGDCPTPAGGVPAPPDHEDEGLGEQGHA